MGYYSVAQVGQLVTSIANQFNLVASEVSLKFDTAEHRKSSALLIQTTPGTPKETVMIMGGVHGAEWGSCEIALNLALMLLRAHSLGSALSFGGQADGRGGHIGGKTFAAEMIAQLLAERDLLIFPLVNPDGREFSQVRAGFGEADWRKNRRPVVVAGVQAGIGIDLNRNFDFAFDLGLFDPASGPVASADPSNTYYQGPAAFSEAETQNVQHCLNEVADVGWLVDLHSAGQSICYSWNHDELQSVNPGMNFHTGGHQGDFGLPGSNYQEFLALGDLRRMRQLANRFVNDVAAVRGTAYDARPAYWNSPYPGTSHDYAYSRHLADLSKSKVLGFVCEWGDMNPQPAWVEMEKVIEEVTAGLIGFCLETI